MLKPPTAPAGPAIVHPGGPQHAPEAGEVDERRRRLRRWAGDVLAVGSAVVLGIAFLEADLAADPSRNKPLMVTVQLVGGAAACLSLLLRRRWPVGVTVTLTLAGPPVSAMAFGASFVALFNVAIRRSWPVTAAVAGLHVAVAVAILLVVPMPEQEFREGVVFFLLVDAVLVASGMLVRSHRMLIGSLRDRARIVLMDIRMPRLDGLSATEVLRSRQRAPEVIILTTFDTDEHVLRAMRSGASGFLLKHTPPAEILRAIRMVAAGEPMLSPSVLRRVMSHAAGAGVDPRSARARELLSRLSDGEHSVARLIGQGRTNSEISRELLVSVATVKAYVSRLLTKLELNNRVQVALLVHDADRADPAH